MHIQTERLALQPLKPTDFDAMYHMQKNPRVMRYLADGARTKKSTQKHLAGLIEHYDRHGFSWCALFEKKSDRFIGL